MILTADKGVTLMMVDKKDYIQKAEDLLGQQQTYKIIPVDLTINQKKRLINLLKNIKAEGGLQDHIYKKITLLEQDPIHYMGLLRSVKPGYP